MIKRIKRPIIRSIIRSIISKGKALTGDWFDADLWMDGAPWYDDGFNPQPPNTCNELPDSPDPMPFQIGGNGSLYLRGTNTDWEPLESARMKYKGGDTYQAIIELSGPVEFKLASSDESFISQLWIENNEKTGIRTDDIELGVIYNVAYLDSGLLNNQGDFVPGFYDIVLQLNVPNPSPVFGIGTMCIRLCSEI